MGPLCLLAIVLWSLPSIVSASNSLTLCSSDNTGAQGSTHFSIYNSYGYCTQQCSGYAYAIMQGQNCWCSNETPSSTTAVSSCSDSCPGYDSDKCGNTDEGLYGYAQIGQPSSTQEASSSTQSSTVSSSSSSSSSPSTTSTTSDSSTTSTSSTSSTSAMSTSATPSTSAATSSSTQTSSSAVSSSTPVTSSSQVPSTTSNSVVSSSSLSSSAASSSSAVSSSTSVVSSSSSAQSSTASSSSLSGSTSTSSDSSSTSSSTTADSTPTSSRTSSGSSASGISPNNKSTGKGFWQQGGKVAGTFVGVGIGILLILAVILFFCLRRRRRSRPASQDTLVLGPGSRNYPSPKSPFGNSSRFTGNTDNHAFAAFANGSFSSHTRVQSRDSGQSEPDFIPIFDQRVDPNQLYMRWEHNGSKTSLQDYEDYSRKVLKVANPDDQ